MLEQAARPAVATRAVLPRARIFEIESNSILNDVRVDDSISVNGVCLTVQQFGESSFQATAVDETLSKTNLGNLHILSKVNLERSMRADSRFGGHYVQGHVDTITKLTNKTKQDKGVLLSFEVPVDSRKFIVERGSITINGISLTIASIIDSNFNVAVIPHTLENTNLSDINIGDYVNIEFDIIAKYIANILDNRL